MEENSAAVSSTTEPGGDTPPQRETGEESLSYAAREETALPEEASGGEMPAGTVSEGQFRLDREREQTRQERARLVAEEQVRQITQLDGEIRSMDDLLAMPEYESFYGLVKKGVSLVEAYKITRYDRLMKRAADAASRQAMRSVGSRQHLTAVAGQAGKGDYVTVPAEIAAEYRLAKPGISEAEMRRKYRKYQKYKRQ